VIVIGRGDRPVAVTETEAQARLPAAATLLTL
jgi:hypothetical protein